MSRQTHSPLLKWRQGAGITLISSTVQGINPMLPKVTAFTFLNSQLWINLLGATSVAILWVLGGSSLKPAHANSPKTQAPHLQPRQAKLLTNQGESQAKRHEASPIATGQVIEYPVVDLVQQEMSQKPLPSEVATAALSSTPVELKTRSLNPTSPLSLVRTESKGDFKQKIDAKTRIDEDAESHFPPYSLNAISSPSTNEERYPTRGKSLQGKGSHQGDTNSASQPSSASNQELGQFTLDNQSHAIATDTIAAFTETPSVSPHRSNTTLAQLPTIPQSPVLLPVPTTPVPVNGKGAIPTVQPLPALPQPPNWVPTAGVPVSPNLYNPAVGQLPYLPQPQTPVPAMGMPMSPNPYNPGMGQLPYYPQPVLLVPVPATGMPMSPNPYNPGVGQLPYYPQNVPPLPAPLNPGSVGFNNYNPSMGGQSPYYPQSAPPLPVAPTMIPAGAYGYNPGMGQPPYYPQNVPPLPAPVNPSGVVPNSYNWAVGQSPYSPQGTPPLPVPLNQNPVGASGYNPTLGQSPYVQQSPPSLPYAPNPTLTPPSPTPTTPLGATPPTPQPTLNRSTALTAPSVQLQGVYVNQGDLSAARARVSGLYPLNSRVQFGATLELVSGRDFFADSGREGLNLNELYVATAPFENLPNFRLVAGQLDLTSYFDRNSFAKDGATHFFNPVFQTNPALSATGLASRPAALVNWTVTDNIEAKAAIFSSARDLGDFSVDGSAVEIGIRYGNAIIRGTYASDRDAGSRTSFREIFGLQRSDGTTGIRSSDREQAYSVNVEYFIPQVNMGIFGRYGRYDNRTLGRGGDTYSAGISFLDVFAPNDRLGLAYGRDLSNELLRRGRGEKVPDVLEVFYDFRFLPNLRLGFTLQQRNGFSDTYAGFRVKTEFNVTPTGGVTP